MTTAHPLPIEPDDTIPASRLMRERDQARLTVLDLRGLLAMAQTDRNRFERERDEARAALTVSRNTLDDLTDHCTRQGAYIAKLQTEGNQLRLRIHHLVEELLLADYDRFALTDLAAGPAGEDCSDCGGSGEQSIERVDWAGNIEWTGRMTSCENRDCFGGRVLR